LFISRDGYNLQKIYNALSTDPIENHYIYASRLFATIFGDDVYDGKDRARCLLEHFSDDEEVMVIGIPEDPSDKDYEGCLNDNADLFEDLLKREHDRYSEYLKAKVGKGDILLVDVTTLKFSSQRFIQDMLGKTRRVVGCYYNLLANCDAEYYAYADRSKSKLRWNEVNVSEFFLGSPEPPVSDITADGTPIFQSDIHGSELFRMSIYDNITRGELDYAEDMKAMFGDEMPKIGHKVLDRWIKVLVGDRSSADPEHLRKIQWAPDPMHTRYRSLLFGPKEAIYMLADKFGDLLWRISRQTR